MPRLATFPAVLLLALAAQAQAAGLSVNIGDFNADDWAVVSITDNGPAEADMGIAPPELGNPGSHWLIGFAVPSATGWSSYNRLGAFYTAQAYDTVQAGALQKLTFSMDVAPLFSSFGFDSIGQIRPALVQDGVAYTGVKIDFIPRTSNLGVYQTAHWDFDAVATDWATADADSAQHPDFSAGASPIVVGFGFAIGASCLAFEVCAPGIALLSVDNFTATLTPVPEPAAWLLLSAGVASLALRRRLPR